MMHRDLEYERELVDLAAQAAGRQHAAGGLLGYAQHRARVGGMDVRYRDLEQWRQEIREELADAVNYCCWTILSIRPAYERGDSWACDQYVQTLGCLVGVVAAWDSLHTTPS